VLRRALFAANWKMNKLPGEGSLFVSELSKKLSSLTTSSESYEVVIAPQAPMLPEISSALHSAGVPNLSFAAQNCSSMRSGAYTGEISAELLSQIGVKYVIIGHSERRTLYHEGGEEIALKLETAEQYGLSPILCVGETKAQFELGSSEAVVTEQLRAALRRPISGLVVAYEPVWAIGTGLAATPEIAKGVHQRIRQELKSLGQSEATRVLYGGSTTPENISSFMALEDVDGALVGGASLDPGKFAELISRGLLDR